MSNLLKHMSKVLATFSNKVWNDQHPFSNNVTLRLLIVALCVANPRNDYTCEVISWPPSQELALHKRFRD